MSTSTRLSSHRARLRRHRRMARIASGVTISVGVAMLLPGSASAAQAPIGLGTAASFAVLAGSGITNTGTTTITGDIGTFPTPTETGVASMVLTGVDHAGDAVTQQAKTDLNTAYNIAAGATPPTAVATELGGTTLTPGIYNGATLQITGILTLDTVGDPNAVFVFQTASTLITASNSAVVVLNGARACNVYWQVGSSATLGTGSHLVGTVLASTSITATTAATVEGRLLALNGAVTLDTNTISNTGCAAAPPATTTPTTVAPPTTVTPTTAPPTTVAPTPTTVAPTPTTVAPTPTTVAPAPVTIVPTPTTAAGPPDTAVTTPTSGTVAAPAGGATALTSLVPRRRPRRRTSPPTSRSARRSPTPDPIRGSRSREGSRWCSASCCWACPSDLTRPADGAAAPTQED